MSSMLASGWKKVPFLSLFLLFPQIVILKENDNRPGWRGSVDWAPAWEPKGLWFDSQSGHMPGLQARSPVGDTGEATTH